MGGVDDWRGGLDGRVEGVGLPGAVGKVRPVDSQVEQRLRERGEEVAGGGAVRVPVGGDPGGRRARPGEEGTTGADREMTVGGGLGLAAERDERGDGEAGDGGNRAPDGC